MASKVEMTRQDMMELYQLARVYQMTYGHERSVENLIKDIEKRFEKMYHKVLSSESNPRHAGRKRRYTQEQDERIAQLREDGYSIRVIAAETGCSVGHVQDVLKRNE